LCFVPCCSVILNQNYLWSRNDALLNQFQFEILSAP
jgi:hypothetical protein